MDVTDSEVGSAEGLSDEEVPKKTAEVLFVALSMEEAKRSRLISFPFPLDGA